MRTHQFYRGVSTLTLSMTVAISARAEPGASMAHLPFLWILATGVSAGLAWLAVRAISHSGRLQTPFRKWALMVVLTIILLVFVSPVVVGMGSILITGRTM